MKKDESGQSMVEMAMVLPVLLLLLIGIIDLGRLLYSYSHIHQAAQETVRLGGLGRSDAEITAFARDYISFEDPQLLEISINPGDSAREPGEYITVVLSYPFEPVTPLIENFFTESLSIKTDSTIRIE